MENNIEPIKKQRGGRRAGSGNKKGCKNSGLFSKDNPSTKTINYKIFTDILKRIAEQKVDELFIPKTKKEEMALTLWNYAVNASKGNPSGLTAINNVMDRLEGKVAPSPEETGAIKESKSPIIINIPKKS